MTTPLTATAPSTDALPFGIGRFSLAWVGFILLNLAGVAFGVYAYVQQLLHGDIVTGLRDIGSGGAVWGLYIAMYVFFIGVSFAGITVASMIRLFGITQLKALARAAELLTIVALLVGGMAVIADLGRPHLGLLNLPKYARPTSPFFGTFTMVVGGYLFASLAYFFLAGRADAAACAQKPSTFRLFYKVWASGYRGTPPERKRHHQVSFWMSLFILPLLVTAHSTLGFIFGIQGGRPGWYSALQAPGFVVMAGISGIGALIAIVAVLRKTLKQEALIPLQAFRWLGNFLWVLIVVYLYFMISEELTTSYAASESDRAFAHELVAGVYAVPFWITVATLVIPLVILFVQFVTKKTSIAWTVAAGLIVNVAAILKRYLLVVGSQTHGMRLPYEPGHYSPTWVEYGVVVGLTCLAIVMYAMFVKVFPIFPVAHHHITDEEAEAPAAPVPGRALRWVLTSGNFLVGLALAVIGFAASSRVGTAYHMDPPIPYAPVLFIVGVIMIFSTGAVYETLPPVRKPTEPGNGTESSSDSSQSFPQAAASGGRS